MSDYKPHLPSDKSYLDRVRGTMAEREQLDEIEFSRLNDSLGAIGVNTDPYSLLSADSLYPEELQNVIDSSYEAIGRRVNTQVKRKLTGLWDYLSETDKLEPADLAFVFGGPGIARVKKAAELYKQGKVRTILFSGKHASYVPDVKQSEAEYYRELAIESGVPEGDITIETEARNTPENVANSVKILRQAGELPRNIIAITLPYHMRRSWLTLRAGADWDPKVMRCTVPSARFTRDNYFQDHDGWSYIFSEYIKLYGARLMKHF